MCERCITAMHSLFEDALVLLPVLQVLSVCFRQLLLQAEQLSAKAAGVLLLLWGLLLSPLLIVQLLCLCYRHGGS
jgi:hypothetical protein